MTAFASPRRLARLHPRAGIRRRHGTGLAAVRRRRPGQRPVRASGRRHRDRQHRRARRLSWLRRDHRQDRPAGRLDPLQRAFPYGFASPISTSVYYPADIAASDAKLPVITFVGGILSNAGNYHELMKLWASHGFIVVISSDFINSFPLMHALGILEVAKLDRDPGSALHDRADFSRTLVAGHSPAARPHCRAPASAQALQLIEPRLKLVGALPIEPGPWPSVPR